MLIFSSFNPLGRTFESHCLCGDSLQVNVPSVNQTPFLKLSQKASAFINCLVLSCGSYSAELEKPVPGQPSTNEILQAVLKECGRENPKYMR